MHKYYLMLFFKAAGAGRLLVFKAMQSWEKGMGIVQISATELAVLTQIQLFFLNKCSSDCCKTLVNFRSSKKLILTMFASVLITYVKEWVFQGPCSIIHMYLSLIWPFHNHRIHSWCVKMPFHLFRMVKIKKMRCREIDILTAGRKINWYKLPIV